MSSKQARKFRKAEFISDEGGNTIMMFGLSFIPVMFMLGAATDYTRLTITRAALQQGTDAASLAVASKMTNDTTLDDAKKQAQVILRSQPKLASATVTDVTITPDKRTLCTTSQMTIKNAFMQIAQIANLTPSVTTCASLAGGVDPQAQYEISLVLDNSGSMSSSAGGVSKMQALRTAATSFVDTMFSKAVDPGKMKISVTPFNATVRAVDPSIQANRTRAWVDTAGNSSIHWRALGGKAAATAAGFTNRFDIFDKLRARRSSWDWNGCFESQPYPMNVDDTPPTSSDPNTLLVPYLSPDEPDGYYSTSTGAYVGTNSTWNSFDYNNSYLTNDNPGSGCSGANSQWDRLTKVCKYNISTSAPIDTDTMGPDGYCSGNASQTVLRLSASKPTINTMIGALVEGGNTNVHEGILWGLRTISPNAPFSDGTAYNSDKVRKIMIVMTDGANVWTSRRRTVGGSDFQAPGYYSFNGAANVALPNGIKGDGVNYQTLLAAAAPNNSTNFQSTARDAVDDLALQTCTSAKAKGVEIFTIGFSTPDDQIDAKGLELLQNCATNVDHYYKAENASQLNLIFSQIGIGLGSLRLSQ
ncbi:MAG: hypothetical protein CTY15_12660 [Methylocystis sp.]|nr:MAG: hypothetical protein CTY15_12660 [Methylocystis sp.]